MRRATFFMLFTLLLCPRAVDAGGLLSCTMSASAVSFGTYNPLTPTPLDTTGTLTYQCDFVVLPSITLTTGSSSTYTALISVLNVPLPVTVYARVPAQQNALPARTRTPSSSPSISDRTSSGRSNGRVSAS